MDQVSENQSVAAVETSQPSQSDTKPAQPSPESVGKETKPPAVVSPSAKTTPEGTEIGNAEASKPEYQPNFKFKVMDKEHEVDEWLRAAIKDAETEKKVKELYEKAYGLEPVKASRDKIQQEATQYKQGYSALYKDVEEVMKLKNSGDLDSFFERVDLKPDAVAQWMLEKLKIQELPPDQQRVYHDLNAKNKAERDLARQLEITEAQNRQLATQAREWEVDQWLAKPDLNPIVSRYDSKNGQGAFKSLVGELGIAHFHAYGEDPTVESVVSKAMKLLGGAYDGQPAQSAQVTQNQEKQLPVIPNISGKNVSPTQKSVRSIEDLKKLRKEMTQ